MLMLVPTSLNVGRCFWALKMLALFLRKAAKKVKKPIWLSLKLLFQAVLVGWILCQKICHSFWLRQRHKHLVVR